MYPVYTVHEKSVPKKLFVFRDVEANCEFAKMRLQRETNLEEMKSVEYLSKKLGMTTIKKSRCKNVMNANFDIMQYIK